MAEVATLLKKLNVVQTFRFLKQREVIEEDLVFPQTLEEEQDQVRRVLFAYLKHRFKGCAIRPNSLSFSIRFDSQMFEKAIRIRHLMSNDQEWRRWFEQNHRELYRAVRNHQAFSDGMFEFRQGEGEKWFLYIPHTIPRIRDYSTRGLNQVLEHLERQYIRETEVAEYYDRANVLMQQEIVRREEERRRRLEAKRNEYFKAIKTHLLKPLRSGLDRNSATVEAKLANKMIQWCRENGKSTIYFAEEPTYENIISVGTDVRILRPSGSRETNWLAVPMFDGFAIPEGYEEPVPGTYGTVTKYDTENERSQGGTSPIVINDFMFLGWNLDQWRHVLPTDYWEILEVTRRFREEAEAEYAQEQEAERIRLQAEAERLQELQREREVQDIFQEERRAAQQEEEAAARVSLTEQLRAQVNRTELRGTSEPGLYKDSFASAGQQFVAINNDTIVRRFANVDDAADWLDETNGDYPDEVQNYYNPSNVVMKWDFDDEEWVNA